MAERLLAKAVVNAKKSAEHLLVLLTASDTRELKTETQDFIDALGRFQA